MKSVRFVLLAGLILSYAVLFSIQEKRKHEQVVSLQPAMPYNVYRITGGYLKEVAAEMMFVRLSVFLGGLPAGTSEELYVDALSNNFDVMTRLYPYFIDPYYYCQAFLPHISLAAAAKTNSILERGIAANPDELILRFFYGTNCFLLMHQPLKAAKVFLEASKLTHAPAIFAHLAALLSAEGGDVAAGLISLKMMLSAEKDNTTRTRYKEEIVVFEQAVNVQKALKAYTNKYKEAPQTLEQLIPEFVSKLPSMNGSFVFDYKPPNLHLVRR